MIGPHSNCMHCGHRIRFIDGMWLTYLGEWGCEARPKYWFGMHRRHEPGRNS